MAFVFDKRKDGTVGSGASDNQVAALPSLGASVSQVALTALDYWVPAEDLKQRVIIYEFNFLVQDILMKKDTVQS
ncbi:MAG: hypothetical protein M0Z45_06095 [Actinomycetota bacterium]|nr:hypothetical protein [Actinomycetota bacterium]